MSEKAGPLPLRRRFWARTRSVEEAQEAINRACGPVALEIEPDAGPIEWRSERFTLGPIEIATHWLSAPAVLRPEQGDDLFLMLGLGERGLRSAVLRIERRALEQHLRLLTGVRPEEPLVFAPTLDASSGAGAEIRRLLLFILDALDQESCVLRSPLVLASLSDALMTALLVGQPHNHAALFATPRAARPPAPCLRLVEEYIEAHVHEPITTADLARVAGVSARTVQTAFRDHRGCSPKEFLKERRLERAHLRLLAARPGATVTAIAHDCGFQHLGQFSVDYRRRFGESPSETLRRAGSAGRKAS